MGSNPAIPTREPVDAAPSRIRLSRRAGWRKPEGAVVVARPSRWGNPHRIGDPDPLRPGRVLTRAAAVERFRALVEPTGALDGHDVRELAGHDLACWCRLDEPCHADVLLELANR